LHRRSRHGKRKRGFDLDALTGWNQMQSLWLPAIQAQLALDRKNPALALTDLQAASSPIELGQIGFVANVSCLSHVYVRGKAYLAAGQGSVAAEFQKILDHSGIVWNCWTGTLAHLGVARAYALQSRTLHGQEHGADADAARFRALAPQGSPHVVERRRPRHPDPEASQGGVGEPAAGEIPASSLAVCRWFT
jgi:hypothetical protein